MKRLCLCLLLTFSLFLSACTGSPDTESYEAFRNEILKLDTVSFSSELSCVYPDRKVEFELYCEGSENGFNVKVLSPELIKGSSVSYSSDGCSLNYGDISIDTGSLDDYGLTPLSSLPALIRVMKDGYADSCWLDGDNIVYELILNDKLKADIWFNPLGTVPWKAEILSGSSVKVFCSINNWLKIME